MHGSNMTRRSFMKTAALTGVAAAMGVSMANQLEETDDAFADAPADRKAYHTCCHGCIQMCPVVAYVENGVCVKIEGDQSAPLSKGGICLKCLSQLHTVYSPRHVLHPMKRVGQRGTNEWEVVSWDDAIDYAAEQFVEIKQKYGDYAFFCATGGGGFYSSRVVEQMAFALGACNQLSPGANQCYMPRVACADYTWGGGWTGNQSAADHSNNEMWNEYDPKVQVIVEWGAQPSTSQTAESGRGAADARSDRGVKTIVIDPFMTPDAAKADIWLSVRPGYDTGLLLSWIKYIIENKLYDEDFCKYWTDYPFLIDPDTKQPVTAEEFWPDYVNPAIDPNDVYDTPAYVCFDELTNSVQPFPYTAPEDSPVSPALLGEYEFNGKTYKTAMQIQYEEAEPWTLEKAEEVTWVPADKNEAAIKMYTDAEYANLFGGVFSDMMNCSSQVPFGTIAIEMMMGHVEKPGSSLTDVRPSSRSTTRKTKYWNLNFWRYGIQWKIGWTKTQNDKYEQEVKDDWTNNRHKDGDWVQSHYAQMQMDRLGGQQHKGIHHWAESQIPAVREAIKTGEPYPLKSYYEVSGNKLAMIGDANAWYAVRDNLDFVCQQYANMTSFTIEFVDLFLPTEEWLEWETGSDADFNAQLNYNYLRRQVIHLGETAHNLIVPAKVINKICEKLGGEDQIFDRVILNAATYNSSEEAHQKWAAMWNAPSWEELCEHQEDYSPRIMAPELYWQYNQHEDIAEDDLPVGFCTMSRKCEPYAYTVVRMARTGWPYLYPFEQEACDDYSPICSFIEPEENFDTDGDEYPLTFTSGRVAYWHHGTMRHAPFNRELLPAPDVQINPETAAQYGIGHQDWVKLTSKRGEAHGRAYLTEGIAPGVVLMERFWNPECFDSSQKTISGGWQECNCNCLTLEGQGNELFSSETYRAFQVKIEKSEKPDRVWVEPEEFEPFMPTLHDEPQTEAAM